MATALVSGRVDEADKMRAEMHIRRAGMTSSDVIRVVWHNIAATGIVPKPESQADAGDIMGRLRALRETTPCSDYLRDLTPDEVKKELESRG